MSLVTLKEIMNDAVAQNAAVPMFNVLNLDMLKGILDAAEQQQSPVILAIAEVHLPYGSLELLTPILLNEARRASVPVCIHLDHGLNLTVIKEALQLGFTSVMYDGSTLSYEENMANSIEVVRMAKEYGASVEAELGHVGGGEGGTEDEHEAMYTNPEQAVEFVQKTGIDALAVAIGTVHGEYRKEPKLDMDRLAQIHSLVDVPLVLHGGSGLSDTDFLNCILRGISKINICTDLFTAGIQGIQRGIEERMSYPDLCQQAQRSIYDAARLKIKLFNSFYKRN